MGSFGVDWNQKSSVLWDWENLPPPIGMNAGENPKNGMLQGEPRVAGVAATMGNEARAIHSSGGSGTFSSSSEMGYGSSRSSMSVSIDSSSKAGNSMEFRYAPAQNPADRNTSKNTELGKVDSARTGASPSLVVPVSSGEPVIGLKLGKRTYFEDVCGGQNVKNSPSGVSVPNRSPASVKKAKVDQHRAHNSYCQVEGCKVDLSSAKEYHRKHRVCELHSKAPKVVVAGLERRFCQQCSRFHGLGEFDQKKRSCRRRLHDHNSRRRKPQPEAISFRSSRMSTMFYDARQQTSLLFGQAPYVQMRSCASSSWDDPGGFKFTETKAPWLKPTTTAGIDETHLSAHQVSHNIMPHGAHHGFDGFMAFKGTSAKFLNQGIEASAVASDSSGVPDLQHALSLLSTNSVGAAANLQHNPQMHPRVTATAGIPNPAMHALGSSPGLWLDGPPLDDHPRFQVFERLGGHDSELQLPKSSYNHDSHFDRMHL